ncbi:hypothetical protein TNCT_209601 [Trichonephila clavata]|uniref:Uncharacterized protein n=1 Tax=Trichonephila clavata TaxID=2740835 RepID=A0A8X6I7N6_TRICU|nr:hypothetical protein TNCT_209601 [Trichonephila clavata]
MQQAHPMIPYQLPVQIPNEKILINRILNSNGSIDDDKSNSEYCMSSVKRRIIYYTRSYKSCDEIKSVFKESNRTLVGNRYYKTISYILTGDMTVEIKLIYVFCAETKQQEI